jgi:hypothetical protein
MMANMVRPGQFTLKSLFIATTLIALACATARYVGPGLTVWPAGMLDATPDGIIAVMIKRPWILFTVAAIGGVAVALSAGSPEDVSRWLGEAILIGALVNASKQGRCRNCR